jgi:hypothetical protein
MLCAVFYHAASKSGALPGRRGDLREA